MDAALHRLEALPGEGRYAVTFRRSDGSEQAATVSVSSTGVDVAPASLPAGWSAEHPAYVAMVEALRAVDRSRTASAPSGGSLRDPAGGWDVSLGNVVLRNGAPACIAHGAMAPADDGQWRCVECGAVASY